MSFVNLIPLRRIIVLIPATLVAAGLFAPKLVVAAGSPPPMVFTAEEDHQRMMDMLGMTNFRHRLTDSYDESIANPYPNIPDPLTLKNGKKVTTAIMWWKERRPEIVEDYEREFYGRIPKHMPKVRWGVTNVTNRLLTNATDKTVFPIIEKRLVGHVDNSSYTNVSVNIQFSLTLPANAAGRSPVIMVIAAGGGGAGPRGAGGFGRGGGGGGGRGLGGANAPGGTNGAGFGGGFGGGGFTGGFGGTNGGSNAGFGRGGFAGGGFGGGRGRGGFGGFGGFGGLQSWQATALSNGWGYASLSTGSVQFDGAAGFSTGIIGLLNKGSYRKLDDWGVLRAWAWGASRALDYLETDKAVDAKKVGVEGHSRDGKAAIVAMAFDQRFAICYSSSSGLGGAEINRRNYGEVLENAAWSDAFHWYAPNFIKYAGLLTPGDLPVDGNELVALCAPRPVFIGGGNTSDPQGDGHADPRGMFMAASGASPVYELLGKKGLGTTVFPPIETALIDGDVAYREHSGGHTDGPNWPTFMTFVEKYWKGPGLKPAPASVAVK
jgi:hypothetical protein